MIWLRLALRLERSELVALTLVVAGWAAAALVIAWRLRGFDAEFPDCLGLVGTTASYCEDASLQFGPWDQTAELLLWVALGLPILIGVILGSPIVAREIEEQTAQIAWSFSSSRVEWLLGRTVPVAVAAALLLAVVALSAEVLTVARLGGDDPGFQRFDQRGVLVVVRGLAALTAGLLIGAWFGRTLPAILAASALGLFVVFGVTVALDTWRRAESIVIEQNSPAADAVLPTAMIIEPVAILPDGTVVSDRNAELPAGVSFDALRVVPGSDYWRWVGRESAAVSVISTVMFIGATAITRRRRPL